MQVSIQLQQIGKKFGREWIFRNLSFDIQPGDKTVILGGNGSGKSTLLQAISGFVSLNEGQVIYCHENAEPVIQDNVRNLISLASPYLQLIEDFTAKELVMHVSQFKPFINKLDAEEVLAIAELHHAGNKYIKQFSSGMKQRLRLALAILADTPVLLLDEPVSNLDKQAIAWYQSMIDKHTKSRTVMVCSNAIDDEFYFCDKKIIVSDYKR